MAKDASVFTSLDTFVTKKIYLVNDFALDITGHGDVACRCGWIIDMFHVPSLTTNLLLVSHLTYTSNIVEFCLSRFFIKDLKKHKSIISKGVFDTKD